MKVKLAYTTIAQKLVVGLSGLLLVGFLITHLAGNMLLYSSSGDHKLYNDYAHVLHSNPLLPVAEYTLAMILLAGKGHEPYQEIKGRKLPFSDADHATLALSARLTMMRTN